jgi:hypothetical protein
MAHDIFISYSRKDKTIAHSICTHLDKYHLSYWIDERIHMGDKFMGAIVNAIKTCKITVFVSSESSNQSIHTAKEIAIAFNAGKHIIPFKIDDTSFNEHLEYVLCNLNWVRTTNPPTENALNDLASQIKAILTLEAENSNIITEQQERKFIDINSWDVPQTKIGVFFQKIFSDK